MRFCSIDFGGSTVDVIYWENGSILKIDSYERTEVDTSSLSSFLKGCGISVRDFEEIRVTGGKSYAYNFEIEGIPVVRVDEIDAIGRGGEWLLGKCKAQSAKSKAQSRRDFEWRSTVNGQLSTVPCLVISMGTGTCMVAVRRQGEVALECVHVGGTGVGGGTFLSLCRLLLGESNPEKLIELFGKGDRRKVDLSVGDIVGRDIGRISQDVTASNLGKIASESEIDFSPADLAAGITNLIGQTIATAAVFAQEAEVHRVQISGGDRFKSARMDYPIVLTGKLTRIRPIVKVIFEVARLYDVPIVLPERADFVSAIGAGVAKGGTAGSPFRDPPPSCCS